MYKLKTAIKLHTDIKTLLNINYHDYLVFTNSFIKHSLVDESLDVSAEAITKLICSFSSMFNFSFRYQTRRLCVCNSNKGTINVVGLVINPNESYHDYSTVTDKSDNRIHLFSTSYGRINVKSFLPTDVFTEELMRPDKIALFDVDLEDTMLHATKKELNTSLISSKDKTFLDIILMEKDMWYKESK